jgi:hypothetical protein
MKFEGAVLIDGAAHQFGFGEYFLSLLLHIFESLDVESGVILEIGAEGIPLGLGLKGKRNRAALA